MYNQTSTNFSANQCQKNLVSRKVRTLEGIPPTRGGLPLHFKKAIYWTSCCSNQELVKIIDLSDPCIWRWKEKENKYKTLWRTLSEASVVCNELVGCN